MARRYFVDPLPPPGEAELTGDVAHHLSRVLRVGVGVVIVLADGHGNECTATVASTRGRSLCVEAGPSRAMPRPSREVHIAFAPPRWNRAEWLLEHGTEVGVTTFWPLWTGRTRPQSERLDRWLKIVRAAAGQCDRAWLPTVHPARSLEELLREPDLPATRLLADPAGPPLAGATPQDRSILLVGPEGGFDPVEKALLFDHGFEPRGLGPYVLRTETAALVGAGLLCSIR